MPPTATAPLELTLVLAATRDMGIGRAGTLPWTGLKKEMAYFARVTKRLPADAPPTALNAVIMGRATWDSIPARFRPLKGRLNVVLSRTAGEPRWAAAADNDDDDAAAVGDAEPVRARSLAEALTCLARLRERRRLGRVFVVGGAQVYDAALRLPEARRVLLTRVDADLACDTFVRGLRLDDGGGGGGSGGWRRAAKAEHDAWVGEDVPDGVHEENGTRYEFQMWERLD